MGSVTGKVLESPAEAAGEALDAKAADGCLKTTARKVFLVEFAPAPAAPDHPIRILVCHAKEPKTPVRVCARPAAAACVCTRPAAAG